METVTSPDGTAISYQRSGTGPPLVLVHGSIADRRIWTPVLPALEARFTVYAVDRRGRGLSGDSEAYAFEREFEDVAAVVDAVGVPVNLAAHSFGAICSLEAALLTNNVRRLVLYEPPIMLERRGDAGEVFKRIEDLVAQGDRAGAVTAFYRSLMRMPQEELAKIQARPVWNNLVAMAHTIPREMQSVGDYTLVLERFSGVQLPVLLLVGSETRKELKAVIDVLHRALPDSRVATLEGQAHSAMSTAPKLLADVIVAFLQDPE